jgi:hypothetical protein
VKPVAIGARAHAVLVRAGGVARVLARQRAATFLTAGGEIAWLAGASAPMHPRAILTAAPVVPADEVLLDVGGLRPWQPAPLALHPASAARLARGWQELAARVDTLGRPAGFGGLLAGAPLGFPLDRARPAAEALARACARDDAAGAGEAALALLGLGGGLTPSGDDFVGGALFVRALLGRARLVDPEPWRRAAAAVVAAAATRTHPVSVALLTDLAGGLGWAPLHDLLEALTSGTPPNGAAARLVALGHTSGWDLLAGVGAGLGALPAPFASRETAAGQEERRDADR